MLVLAIESSCDETAAAVVRDGTEILGNVVSSQVAIHAEYGGVVPEIASRRHLEVVTPVIEEALSQASLSLRQMEGIAVTQGPGLAGALLVGISAAKGIAYGASLPIVGVNHIEGHLLAIMLEQQIPFPFLALVVSGGHSHLYRVDGIGRYRTLGQTIDDAAGEAYDKVAKLLGMPYPGGAEIDSRAASGDGRRVRLPRPLLHDGTFNFSFSGLKTAFMHQVRALPATPDEQVVADLCASFQGAVCDVLVTKTEGALEASGLPRVVVAGGVACNSGLRRVMLEMGAKRGVPVHFPSPRLCADNAAMIAVPGDFYLSHGVTSGMDFDALPTWPLDDLARRLP